MFKSNLQFMKNVKWSNKGQENGRTHLIVYHPNNVPKTTAFFTALNIYTFIKARQKEEMSATTLDWFCWQKRPKMV